MNLSLHRESLRLGLAMLFPIMAVALQLMFWAHLEPFAWVLLYPAVFFSSWVGGKRAGVAATLLAALLAWWAFIPRPYEVSFGQSSSLVAVLTFTAMGFLFSLFHDRLRHALQSAEIMKAQLEQQIAERTGDLTRLVSELRFKESALAKSQQIAKMGSWSYSLDGALVWSDELYRLYGVEPGAFTPSVESFLDLIHPDDRGSMRDWITRCSSGADAGEIEFRIVHPNGALRFINGRGGLSYDSEGKPLMSGTAQDITERKQVEIALRESDDRLRLFIEYAPASLAMFDSRMRYLYASRRWRTDYGLGERPLAGVSHYEVFPEIPQQWKELHRRGLLGEILRAEADPLVRADGSLQWIRWEIRPWRHYDGAVGGIVIFTEDVTERKQTAENLQRLNEELEERVAQRTDALAESMAELEAQNEQLQQAYAELERETSERVRTVEELRQREQLLINQSRLAAMGEMLGYIAHQWRQPLNVLGLNLQVLGLSYKHGSFTKELLEENVGKAMEVIKHLSRTIDDFRDFLVLNKEKTLFCVNDVIAKTVGLIRESLNKEEIEVVIEPSGAAQVSGFPNEYSHVILNLLSNARDAFSERTAAEGRRVTIRSGSEGEKSVVTVTDNAGGIDPAIMDRIFDAYFTTKGLGKGSGVGLFMSKMIIEKNMGGRLSARNVEGGAEFRIEV